MSISYCFGAPVITGSSDFGLPGQKIGGCELVEKVGEGGFSTVWKALDNSGRTCIIKSYHIQTLGQKGKKDDSDSLLAREVSIFKKINETGQCSAPWNAESKTWDVSPAQIISPIDIFSYMVFGPEMECYIYACISMPYYPISLNDLIGKKGRLGPDYANSILAQLFRALTFLHGMGYVHCDIKPGNLLISADYRNISGPGDVRIMLIDFNTSYKIGQNEEWRVGTFDYMAPEIMILKKPIPGSDIWAASALAFEILTGNTMFDLDNTTTISGKSRPENIDSWINIYKMVYMYEEVMGPMPGEYAEILRKKGVYGPENNLVLHENSPKIIDLDGMIGRRSGAKKMSGPDRVLLARIIKFIKEGIQYDVVARNSAEYWQNEFK